MKFLSSRSVTWAINELRRATHPFVGVTFLACKDAGLPVATGESLSLDAITRTHLEQHHHLDPASDYYFQPFKSNKWWLVPKYPSSGLQAINTQTFGSAFIHEKNTGTWGFDAQYVTAIADVLHSIGAQGPPLDAIAIWLGKSRTWGEGDTLSTVVRRFLESYRIEPVEQDRLFVEASTSDALDSIGLFSHAAPNLKSVAYEFEMPPDIPEEAGGALSGLRLRNIGPAQRLDIDFGERLTVIAGDNGLGKSFLLEVGWWAVTGGWAGNPALPFDNQGRAASIACEIRGDAGPPLSGSFSFDWRRQAWVAEDDRPGMASLCVFARVDGSFAVGDEVRGRVQGDRGSPTSVFTSFEVWNGKAGATEGLVRDWVTWQLAEDGRFFGMLKRVLDILSPEDLGVLTPGKPTRLPGDPRQIPTIAHAYGNVPVPYASAGVQRILQLAYVIIWAWQEHTVAAEQAGELPTRNLLVVVDEIEAHLHPRWQRTILPAVLRVGKLLDEHVSVQVVVSTHSPMVLASIEGEFGERSDTLYHLELKNGEVRLNPVEFHKQGDFSAWLTSPLFGLKHARSREAERAIEAAKGLQLDDSPEALEIEKVSNELRRLLSPDDPFWPRWGFFAERLGVES